MDKDKKEKTVPLSSAPPDEGQSNQNLDISITENEEKCKEYLDDFAKMQKDFRRISDPSYMKTVTMSEL